MGTNQGCTSKLRRRASRALILVLAAAVAAGCGASNEDSSGVPIIHWTTDLDPTGAIDRLVADCNKQHAGEWKIEQVIMPPSVDAKREQLTRRLAAQDESLDILSIDVVWTAEFSEAGWIMDLTERVQPIEAKFIPSVLETARWDDKYWAIPVNTNVALLYYRTDLVDTAPQTWEQMAVVAKQVQQTHPEMDGFLFQAFQYEGLTVDAIEFISAAGGSILDESGDGTAVAQGDGAEYGLQFMRQLVEDNITPGAVVTYQEEDSRQTFQNGRAVFLRNWPYVYPLANEPTSKVAGKFAAAPLPGFEGRERTSVLGGANFAISNFSPYMEESWEALQCLGGENAQRERALVRGELPAIAALYDDAELRKKLPYLDAARESLDTAISRPATPYYNDVSRAIYTTSNDVVAGRITAAQAVKSMDESLARALKGDAEI